MLVKKYQPLLNIFVEHFKIQETTYVIKLDCEACLRVSKSSSVIFAGTSLEGIKGTQTIHVSVFNSES